MISRVCYLSFVLLSPSDTLLGLIASVSSSRGGNDGAISIVENLVTSYIKKPSCIILLTVACESKPSGIMLIMAGLIDVSIADFENQGAHRLVKVHDPQGMRTIGTPHSNS